jgi:crotonobetainyl-CoA:carnitine CoA-transferase CaiB-like acyl-CoA transferase
LSESDTPGSLAGLRVVDLSRVVAGPLCTQMLADHGADVVKVEGPGGDELRTYGPPFGPGTSAYYEGINRNKRNVCLDLRTAGGQEVLGRLLAGADVVVENFRVGTMAAWGFGYEEVLAERHPALVYCRISGFGADGPMGGKPGYDAMLQAISGIMSVTGNADGPPTRVGVPVVDLTAAFVAFSGILLALLERAASGRGQLVDCALLDAAVSLLHPHAAAWAMFGAVPARTGDAHGSVAPYQAFATRTGPILLAANNDRQFRVLAEALGRPGLADDPRFATTRDRVAHRRDLAEVIGGLVAGADREALAERLTAAGVAAAPVYAVPDALAQPQIAHRNLLVELGRYRALGVPVKLVRTPGRVARAPVRRGADTVDVLTSLGYGPAEIGELCRTGAAARLEEELVP